MEPEARILVGNSLDVLKTLEAGTVDVCVTSPPYFGLRDYKTEPYVWPAVSYSPMPGLPEFCADEWSGALGQEPTPEMYVAHLVLICREIRRVLKKTGTFWLNLGDSSAANRGYQVADTKWRDVGNSKASKVPKGLKPKDLIGIPWRVAFALQADGWWLRQDNIWHKPNVLPRSVTDNTTLDYEHVFMFARSPKYWFDQLAISEDAVSLSIPSRRTNLTTFSSAALGPEVSATLYAEDSSLDARGWVNLGQSKIAVNGSMALNTQRLQIVQPVGLKIGIETSEGYLVVNLENPVEFSAGDTLKSIPLFSERSLDDPVWSSIADSASTPCGAVLACQVDTSPLPSTLSTAKVVGLELTLESGKWLVAKIALNIESVLWSFFVFTSLWSSHVSLFPYDTTSTKKGKSARNKRTVWSITTKASNWEFCRACSTLYIGLERRRIRKEDYYDEDGTKRRRQYCPCGACDQWESHFATYPKELAVIPVRAGISPEGACIDCGKPYRRVTVRTTEFGGGSGRAGRTPEEMNHVGKWAGQQYGKNLKLGPVLKVETEGFEPSCGCGAPSEPCVVLDPFAGSGTTGIVSLEEGASFIGIELNSVYAEIARQRIKKETTKERSLF